MDNAFLVSLVGLRPEKHFWIGLSNQNNLDIFTWTNTEFVKFTHWNGGMPGMDLCEILLLDLRHIKQKTKQTQTKIKKIKISLLFHESFR